VSQFKVFMIVLISSVFLIFGSMASAQTILVTNPRLLKNLEDFYGISLEKYLSPESKDPTASNAEIAAHTPFSAVIQNIDTEIENIEKADPLSGVGKNPKDNQLYAHRVF